MSSGLMCIDCRFWRKFWLIKVQELKWRQSRGILGDRPPSLTPHSLKDSSIKSHQLGVASTRVMKFIGSQANDS